LNPSKDKRFFLSPTCPDRLWSPPTLLFQGIKGPESKVDSSPPPTAVVKNDSLYICSTRYGVSRHNFTLLPLITDSYDGIKIKNQK
jgi:hypothetical protein